MIGNKKTASIVSLVLILLIASGFIFLIIRVHTIPDISCIQSEDTQHPEENDLYMEMPISNEWNDSGYKATQYAATLKNNTLNTLKDWSVIVKLPKNAIISDSWNINIESNEYGSYVITNDSEQGYNDTIDPNGEITFGFILFTNEDHYEINHFILKASPLAKISDYPLFYILCALIILLLIYVSMNFAMFIRDRQYKIRRELDKKIIIQSMKTFTNFIDAKDPYTRGHSIRVAFYTKKIAEKMGFEDAELYNIYYIALLHDVGKINIPDSILNKPGALTKEEMDIIKTHTTNGALILKDFSSLPSIVEGARYHHERYDGTGYPEGIKGEQIPLVARIIGVADAFDAMNSDRCYRKAFTMDRIISELKEGAGKQFDPDIVKVMLDLIDKKAFINMNSELKDE